MSDKIIPLNGYAHYRKKEHKSIKKFLLFCGAHLTPIGGWDDCEGVFQTVKEALEYLKNSIELDEKEWYHIIDLHTLEKVVNVQRKMDNYE